MTLHFGGLFEYSLLLLQVKTSFPTSSNPFSQIYRAFVWNEKGACSSVYAIDANSTEGASPHLIGWQTGRGVKVPSCWHYEFN